jgi:hypothetical protein
MAKDEILLRVWHISLHHNIINLLKPSSNFTYDQV